MPPNILVLGASSSVGTELVNRLAHIGTQVRAAIYNAENTKDSFHYPTVETVPFDFKNQHSIEQILKDIENVFVITPLNESVPLFVNNTLLAARSLPVKHIGFLSVLGTDDNHGPVFSQWFREAEYLVKNSTIPYTILRSNFLMQNILYYLQRDSNSISLPAGEGTLSFIDSRDVASVVADIFLPGTHHLGKIYTLTGLKAYSMFQVADILSRVSGQYITYVNYLRDNPSYSQKSISSERRHNALLDYISYLFSGTGSVITDTVEKIAGMEPLSFIDFARDYAQSIRSIMARQA